MKKRILTTLLAFVLCLGAFAQNPAQYGVINNNPDFLLNWYLDDVNTHLHIWENTLAVSRELVPAVPYGSPLSFKGNGTTWYGFGLMDDNGADISYFADGMLVFHIMSESNENVEIIVGDHNKKEKKWVLNALSFPRDGNWHEVKLNVSDIVANGVDLTNISHIFAVAGPGKPKQIGIDNIYYTNEATTSIEANKINKANVIYTNGVIRVQTDTAVASASVYNIAGSLIITMNGDAKTTIEIPAYGWNSGTYIVKVTDVNKNEIVEKIMFK